MTWGDVDIDTYIRDANGVIWRVCAIDETTSPDPEHWTGSFRCRNAAGAWMTISPKLKAAGVTIVDEVESHIALLRDKLGAEVVATQDHATKSWKFAAWPETPRTKSLDEFRTHLELAHGMYVGDVKGYARLVEAHDEAHDPDSSVGKHLTHHH